MLFTLHFVRYSIILIIFNRGISGVVLLFSADVIPCGFLCALSRCRPRARPSLRPASVVFCSQPALVVFALVFVESSRTSVLFFVCARAFRWHHEVAGALPVRSLYAHSLQIYINLAYLPNMWYCPARFARSWLMIAHGRFAPSVCCCVSSYAHFVRSASVASLPHI